MCIKHENRVYYTHANGGVMLLLAIIICYRLHHYQMEMNYIIGEDFCWPNTSSINNSYANFNRTLYTVLVKATPTSLRTYCSLRSFCLSLSGVPASVRASGLWAPWFSLPITKNTTSSSRVVMYLVGEESSHIHCRSNVHNIPFGVNKSTLLYQFRGFRSCILYMYLCSTYYTHLLISSSRWLVYDVPYYINTYSTHFLSLGVMFCPCSIFLEIF